MLAGFSGGGIHRLRRIPARPRCCTARSEEVFMRQGIVRSLCLVGFLTLAACAPAPPRSEGRSAGEGSSSVPATGPKTLLFGVRYEINDVFPKITSGTSSDGQKRLFTASLAYMDGNGVINPYLAETLPTVENNTWRIFPDGRMETTDTL